MSSRKVYALVTGYEEDDFHVVGVYESHDEAEGVKEMLGLPPENTRIETHILNLHDSPMFSDHETDILMACLLKSSDNISTVKDGEMLEDEAKKHILWASKIDQKAMDKIDIDNLIEFEYLMELEALTARLYRIYMGIGQ